MKLTKPQIIGISIAFLTILVDLIFFLKEKIFYFILGIAFVIAIFPFIVSIMILNQKEKENNEMFLEFARNLAESTKAGTPIGKAILNTRGKDFGPLTPHIEKLSNQINIGIPLKQALSTFAKDVHSIVIERAVNMIAGAENAGGEIEDILDSVAKSVNEIEQLKKERLASVYNLVVQGYIIFFVFIIIMLIMQFKILPMTSQLSSIGGFGGFSGISNIGTTSLGSASSATGADLSKDLSRPMLYLLLLQGFFTGLVIGKLAEGSIKYGIKHSFFMVSLSILIYTGVNAFLST